MIYRKVPQCRVCSSDHGIKIDRDLMERVTYQKIIENRGHLFPKDKPLTKACLFNHWSHIKEAVQIVVDAAIASRTNLPATLDPKNPPQTSGRQQIFNTLVEEGIDEVRILERLVKSGLSDLERLEKDASTEGTKPDDLFVKNTRNKIRKDTASITSESAKLKLAAAQNDQAERRIEKARIVYRMFELMRTALDVVPNEVRPLVAAALKEGVQGDDELRDLLQAHAPNKEPTEVQRIEPSE